jgi:hypothetical protein
VPVQATPQAAITWEALRLSGHRCAGRARQQEAAYDELYLTSFAPHALRMELDRIPLWRGDHVR